MPALGLGRIRKWLYAGRLPTAGKSEILVERHYGAFDFTALRYAYAENAQYNPYDANEAELTRSMVSAMNARDCTSAMKPAPAILEKTTSVSMRTSLRRFVSGNSNFVPSHRRISLN